MSELQTVLERAKRLNPRLNAYISIEAKDGAASPKPGKLSGFPIAVKDNICVQGWEATCASKILKGYVAPYNAAVIERLLAAGAVLVGRTNMDEFAFGSSCETSCYGPTRNPWDVNRSPGGSSGGSAAAVAAGLARAALGSDTGGSIRQPASFCGIVGLKPTYGRVSRYGLIAFGSSLDQIGPMTRTVDDAARILGVIAGFDPRDSTSANLEVPDYTRARSAGVKGLKVGLPKEFFGEGLSPEVKKIIDGAVKILEKEGAVFENISLPHTKYAVPVYYVVAPSEASSNLARFDGVKYGHRDMTAKSILELYRRSREQGFGEEAKRRILLGTFALSSGYYDAFYLKAMKVRARMISDYDNVFRRVDCVLTPTAPTPAFKIGEKSNDPLSMYLSDIYTISANLAGIPAVSVPGGLTDSGLPVGVQLMGKAFAEETLFRAAYVLEDKTGSARLAPKEFA